MAADGVRADNLDATIEALIDKHTLYMVLDSLSRVAWEKGQHLRENWQDTVSAKRWEKAGVELMNLGWSNCIKGL